MEELTVEKKIELRSLEYDLDPELMKKIAWSESNYKNVWNYMHDVDPNYYTAFGVFQIVKGTYRAYCGDPEERFDVDKNIECAMIIASESGIHHWDESKYMWDNS